MGHQEQAGPTCAGLAAHEKCFEFKSLKPGSKSVLAFLTNVDP